MLRSSHVGHNQLGKLDSRIGNELLRALLHFKYQWMDKDLNSYSISIVTAEDREETQFRGRTD